VYDLKDRLVMSSRPAKEKPDGQTSNADDAIRAVDGILQIDTDIQI